MPKTLTPMPKTLQKHKNYHRNVKKSTQILLKMQKTSPKCKENAKNQSRILKKTKNVKKTHKTSKKTKKSEKLENM